MAAESLVKVAERHNPKRAFVLVSTVLGKHMPVTAPRCRLAGLALGLAVAGDPRAERARLAVLEGTTSVALDLVDEIEGAPVGTVPHADEARGSERVAGAEPYLVIGFAETATALGEQVATALDAVFWQTTTRQASIAASGIPFDEPHSHAPVQWIAEPLDGWPDGTMVLVDDELTTGATACNLIEVIHGVSPRPQYVIAAILDGRAADGAGLIERLAERLGVTIDVVSLATRDPEQHTVAGWSGGALPQQAESVPPSAEADIRDLFLEFDGALQHDGQDREARLALAEAALVAAAEVGPLAPRSLVLGTGEHLAFAQRASMPAAALVSSTTRSPVLVSNRAEYPIRDGLAFANPDDLAVPGFAYNVHPADRPSIVVHFQDGDHRERGQALLDALVAAGARDLTAVTLAP
ncbi:MAG: phosphoribosyltransferase domain-containing protein [Solirubrobacteraceae bacterium]|nr:phosphoribosyltransferase domain-containing protein [Patulibacter sp.]